MQERHNWHDAMSARLAQYQWAASREGQEYMADLFRHNAAEYADHQHIVSMMQLLYSTEDLRLQGATPFFVSAEMAGLVEAAMLSFSPEPIYPTDVLKLQGFLWYEEPITIMDRFDRPMQVRAFSWQPVMDEPTSEGPARMLTREDEMKEYLADRHSRGLIDGLGVTLYIDGPTKYPQNWPEGRVKPPLVPFHISPWAWGMSFDGNEVTVEGRPTGADWWWKAIQTTWRLMQQHIAVRHFEVPPRPMRREAKRIGLPVDDTVVVRLRREYAKSNGDEPTGEGRTLSYRHLREGHWRNQPYPSEGVHRQIWIAQTIVGDESLPLVIKPNRVFNWDR